MNMISFALIAAILALSAVWLFAINTSIKALRAADPALYRAAAIELAGHSFTNTASPDASLFRMRHWMWRMSRHNDVRKHRAVRRWMYVHRSAQTALIIVISFGVAMFFLH
jgi:hypothetical protein